MRKILDTIIARPDPVSCFDIFSISDSCFLTGKYLILLPMRDKNILNKNTGFLVIFLLLFGLPVVAYADCILTVNCASASAIPQMSRSYPSREACESERARGQAIVNKQGGGCTYTCSCVASPAGAGTVTPGLGGLSTGDPLLDLSSQILCFALGQLLSGGVGSRDNAAEQARHAAEIAEIRRRIEELKPVEFLGVEGFQEYHNREAERRKVLEKTTDVWCKLHPPLYPTRPIMPIPDDEYERMMAYYKARKIEFDQRCKEMAQAKANLPKETFCSGILCGETGEKPRGTPGPLPISCSACWRNFDTESGGCAGLQTDIELLVCINGTLD